MSNPYSSPDPGIAQQERDLERIERSLGLVPHVHPDTVRDLERRVAALEKVPPTLVYAHVERTVHALLDEIGREATARLASPDWTFRVKALAEAVQALSSWPQFNPMNAVDDYRKLAEHEVERAIKQRGVRISGGTSDSERADVGAAFDAAFAKLAALNDRLAKIEGGPR